MMGNHATADRESKLDEILADYLEGLEQGREPDRRLLIERHPEFVSELSEFFADQDRLASILQPLAATTVDMRGLPGPMPRSGQRFGDYELQEEIGRGGMGVVFRALQVSLQRVVALKMTLSGQLASPEEIQRFRMEAEAVAHLDHSGIVPIYEVGEEGGWNFSSMKHIEGRSLARLELPRPLSPADQKKVGILLEADRKPHVTDFGLTLTVHRLGIGYRDLGKLDRALDHYDQARKMRAEFKNILASMKGAREASNPSPKASSGRSFSFPLAFHANSLTLFNNKGFLRREQDMSDPIDEVLSRLPSEKKITREICEHLDKEIRRGVDLNPLQRQGVQDLVRFCLEQGLSLPPPFDSFWAFIYQEWSEEAKTSEEAKKRLANLVQKLKAVPGVAGSVAQTLQKIQKEREVRRQEMARLAAAMAEAAAAGPRAGKTNSAAKPPPNSFITRMQDARLGRGEMATANLELAATIAEEAVDAYPNSPKVLFEAAGSHQLLAQKGKEHSPMTRYVHMKEAYSLYQQCLAILSAQPYLTLKGEYDSWRKGLTDLIVKVQQELAVLEEQQK